MAYCNCQSVRCIFLGDFRQVQEHFEHFLDLVLGCPPMPDNRLFDLKRGIFEDRQTGIDSGNDRCSAGLTEFQCALHVCGEKNIFYGDCVGAELVDDVRQCPINFFQPGGKILLAVGLNCTVVHVNQPGSFVADNAITRDA